MEIKIDFKYGKEYATRTSMERQLKKLGIPEDWRYLVVTNPENNKVRPVFFADHDKHTAVLSVVHKGFMVVG